MMSTLDVRSFQNSPLIKNGQPVLDSSNKTDTILTESITRPTVILPIVFGHYRFKEWAAGGQRVAVYGTGGAGLNLSSTSTDFAVGMSLGINSFMLSPLVHFGRDQRFTNGLTIGEELGSSPANPTTERYWVRKFGFALYLHNSGA